MSYGYKLKCELKNYILFKKKKQFIVAHKPKVIGNYAFILIQIDYNNGLLSI